MIRGLRALDVKVLRDIWRQRSQLLAIAAVLACGIAVFVGMRSTMQSLDAARGDYYAKQRFADVFATCRRAPEHIAACLLDIEHVQSVQTRVIASVTLDVPRLEDAATGQIVSLPDEGRPVLNDIVVRSGRLPRTGYPDEVLVSEAFAEANALDLDSTIDAILNGRRQRLRVVGVALSPEFIWSLPPGSLYPDNRRFGVIWMRRSGLAAAFDMKGAFNDVSLRLARDASLDHVIARVDQVLTPYGGLGAISRKDQISAFFVANELDQLRTFAWLVPVLFLAVAAFLLHVVLGRIIAQQREQIAALKALGYRDGELALHYGKFVAVIVLVGCALGLLVGTWIGSMMTRLYGAHYRFPALPLELVAKDVVVACAIAIVAAAAGTTTSIRRALQLPPAEAMRPTPPATYRPTIVERLGLGRLLPTSARMIVRELERKPGRALLSIAGIAMACGLTVLNAFTFDSMEHLLNLQFSLQDRADVRLSLVEPRSDGARTELEHLPGVQHVELMRVVPARLTAGPRSRRGAITGLSRGARLQVLLDSKLDEVELPRHGLVLSRQLADALDVQCGQSVGVEILEGRRTVRPIEVTRIVETYVGMTAHMNRAALCRLLGETPSCNAAMLLVDDGELAALHRQVKRTPIIAGIDARNTTLQTMKALLDDNIGVQIAISLAFSLVLAFGVLFNAVRITLAERARELASLRVLGFRRGEVAAILLGELAILIAIATPIGLVVGRGLAAVLVASPGFDNDQFRLPLIVGPRSYGLAIVAVLIAGAVSAWSAWRKLDAIDIVEVLKSRD